MIQTIILWSQHSVCYKFKFMEERMKYKGTLLVVKDCDHALKYYHDMFGLQLLQDNDGNMELTGGLYLQESEYYYAVSIVIQEAYRGRNISRQLLDAYFSKYPDKKTCLLAVSKGGHHLAEHYFSLVKDLSENVAVFASRSTVNP